jgi:hypothetical protein
MQRHMKARAEEREAMNRQLLLNVQPEAGVR